MAEDIRTIQMRKNGINHWVLHLLFIVIIALENSSVIHKHPDVNT